ncbi:probable G-protein coupled receptor 139 isoform X1 [Erpetoichthys calabaricus]|uniref:probable G-protein coupled receptor 139 isoform X1 n=1 Tax=Erpetoichthys calabaricus TaxID=27687 RepID=UPI0010A0936E|nr:probable G-protein coupled receptor 139 isoform X1 [Erpetoichthys calabaricus]
MDEVKKTYYIVLCLTGIPANIFAAFVILTRPCQLSKTTTIYLVALACSDTFCLVWAGCYNLSQLFSDTETFWDTEPVICLSIVIEYGTVLSSVWIIVAFTVERYVFLFKKTFKRSLSHPQVAIGMVVGLVIFSYAVSTSSCLIHHFTSNYSSSKIQSSTSTDKCSVYSSPLLWVHFFMTGGAPYFLIIVFNVLIVYNLRMHTKVQPPGGGGSAAMNRTRNHVMRSARLLLTISLTTVALGLPRFIACSFEETAAVIIDLCIMLQWLNSAINFCLFCLACTAFRKECLLLFRACAARLKPSHASPAVGYTNSGNKPCQSGISGEKHEKNLPLPMLSLTSSMHTTGAGEMDSKAN